GGWGSASTSSDSSFAVGVLATADSSAFANAGVFGMVEYATEQEAINGGVVGVATNSHYHNQGGHFETPDSIGDNYGVFAYATNGDFAGYFDGDVHVTGTITSSSDAALKQNIQTLPATDAVAKLQQLQPKTYSFDTQDYPYLNLPTGTQYGLLAQEVEQVLPQLVSNIIQPERRDIKGNSLSPRMEYKGINYMGLVPLLVSAVKDQQTKIDSLQNVIDNRLLALEQRLNNCCERGAVPSDASFKTEGNATVVELNNLQAVVLEQNTPNPFAEQTTINYYIPEGSGTAQVVFFDMLGRTIKSIDAKSGYGSLTVFASNLSQGQYSYALFINGQQIASKSMLKAK
ncbi:MAG TPA: tail fiber domain-containing protein, partial [Bacteroidia bacterium]|nr:tail fiber domain-containing protein [Bacteroidia bacterium]